MDEKDKIQFELKKRIDLLELELSGLRHNIVQVESKNSFLQSLLDSLDDAFYAFDNELRYTYWNKTLERITGIKSEQVIGKPLFDIFPSSSGKSSEQMYHRVLKTGITETVINYFELYNKSGYFEITASKTETGLAVIAKNVTERIVSQQALKESEKFLVKSQQIAHLGHWSLEVKTYKVKGSTELFKIFELPENATFDDFVNRIKPEERNEILEEIHASLKNQKGFSFEKSIIFNDGRIRYIKTIGEPIFDDQNQVTHIIGTAQDITDFKLLQLNLIESEEKYRSLFESSYDAIGVSLNGIILFVNKSYLNMFGFKKEEEVQGHSILETIAPECVDQIKENIDKRKNGESVPAYYETKGIKKNGEIFDFEVYVSLVNIKNQKCSLAIIRDITERKRAQDALKEEEEKFRLTFQTSPDSININRFEDGMYIEVNEGFTRIMGYNPEDVIGKTSLELNIWVNTEDRDELVRGLKEKGYYNNLEAQFRKKNGEIVYGLMSARIINFKGAPHIISITRDIDDRKLAETKIVEAMRRAEQADNLKTQFLYNMSHEIGTPMNAICGFADLLCQADLPYEKQKKFSSIIQRRTNDLLVLIEDILDISKIEAGQMILKETQGDIHEVIKDIYQTWANIKNSEQSPKNITWYTDIKIHTSESIVLIDFQRLKQILNNLISNAYKYTDSGSIVLGCFKNDNSELEFFIRDTGIGISKDKHEIIFDRFRQLEEGYLNRKSGGTGLGLSIVKGLIKLMNGKIWLDSEPGKGSTFHFTVPYNPVDNVKNILKISNIQIKNWSHKTILVVEDDISNIELICALLDDFKFNIKIATRGTECLNLIFEEKIPINLILMDIRMPDINGIQLTKKIREHFPNLPIIAQTAYATSADLVECLQAGCNGYIPKPLSKGKLIELIMSHIQE